MIDDNDYKGRTLDFYSLLKEYKVEIPIIQRDYAQGRADKGELRDSFLSAISNCLETSSNIKLDFIYGSIVGENFQPLDGQQRLTTLFLLYWYVAYKEDELSDELKSLLSKFTYETRVTSREFCAALVNEKLHVPSGASIKDSIVNSNWFFLSWLHDPTIDSMLRCLNDIEAKFSEMEGLWDKLTKESPLISFYFVELENLGLTDDLYIKMNARGKQLTAFENFKAGFQKLIQDEKWDTQRKVKNSFGVKIDNDWTDFFWSHFRKNNSVDDALLRFISAINMIIHSIKRTISKADDRAKHLTTLQEKPSAVRPQHFTREGYDFLYQCFETYMDQVVLLRYMERTLPFPMWRHTPQRSVLSEIVYDENTHSTIQKNSATYTQKVLFYAENQYLSMHPENQFDSIKFQDWMRVVRNIVSRADIDREGSRPDIIRSPQSFDGAINLIHELSEGCGDIYMHLAALPELKAQFAGKQMDEEIAKAKLIRHNPDYQEMIFEAEDNELLRGRISFLFFVMDYNYDCSTFDIHKFKKITRVFNDYFNNEAGLNNDLRRAFLTIEVDGRFEFYNYWWSFWHVGKATKRRLFDKYRELEYYLESDYKEYFKKLLLLLLDTPLERIAENFQPPQGFPNWKLRLIKDKSILDEKSKTNYIAITEGENACYLLKSKRPREIEGSIRIE